MRAIFFDEDDALEVVAQLRARGFGATVVRERLSGEDDDEDHPWAVVSDAPAFMLELVVDEHDGARLCTSPETKRQRQTGDH